MTCTFSWENDEPCDLPLHKCIAGNDHIGPHVCQCGERLKRGGKWAIGSSVDPRTGKRIAARDSHEGGAM